MKPESREEAIHRLSAAIRTCKAKGWSWVVGWLFTSPSGTCHDLSSADLTQLDLIESKGLFEREP